MIRSLLFVPSLLLLHALTGCPEQRQGPSRPALTAAKGAHVSPRPAPAWRNSSWLNTAQPLTLSALRGKVVLLNFWTFTCYNCTNTVPSLVDFDQRFRDRGLVIIGMHDPEFPPSGGEHDKANVQGALDKYGIAYPNAQDNDHATWNLYGIRYWPSFVLIDRKGNIRYEGYGEFHVGDKTYQKWEARIQALLAEEVAAVEVRIVPAGDKVVIRAIPRAGTQINARLPPQLEFASGGAERLRSTSVTADSAYFTAPPEVVVPAATSLEGALIRASICDSSAAVCRVVTLPL